MVQWALAGIQSQPLPSTGYMPFSHHACAGGDSIRDPGEGGGRCEMLGYICLDGPPLLLLPGSPPKLGTYGMPNPGNQAKLRARRHSRVAGNDHVQPQTLHTRPTNHPMSQPTSR